MLLFLLITQNSNWFTADNIVAFTGCISFLMLLHKTLKEKIKFKFKVEDTTIHFNDPKNFESNTKPKRQGLIRITTLNLSYTPATIHEIKIYPKHQKNKEISFWIKDVNSMWVFFLDKKKEKQAQELSLIHI